MPTFAVHSQAPRPRPELEPPFQAELLTPVGVPYKRDFERVDISGTLQQIDAVLAENDAPRQEVAAAIEENSLAATGVARATLAEALPQESRARVKFAAFSGELAVRQAVEHEDADGPASGPTLASSISEARRGNKEAEALVDINVGTATTEGYFKSGHITRITKERNAHGEVVQFGVTTENMQRNSLVLRPNRPQALKAFTLAEAQNGFREQELIRDDKLQDSWFIVPSCVPEELPEHLLDDRGDGYFTRTMTFALQGTTQQGAEIITQTVFDQGTTADISASYEQRQAERFDIAAIGKVYERLGLPAPQTALDMLKTPLSVSKELMPNGMVDFWRWVDEAHDSLRGIPSVRNEQDYIDRIAQSEAREASLAGAKQRIKQELLALDGTFGSDMHAINTLWELVRTHGLNESVTNEHIDPIAFGVQAADSIAEARYRASIGDIAGMNRALRIAEEVATISGCGGGAGRNRGRLQRPEDLQMLDGQDPDNKEDSEDEDQYGSLTFSCPSKSCGRENRRPRGKLVPACQHCGESVRCD